MRMMRREYRRGAAGPEMAIVVTGKGLTASAVETGNEPLSHRIPPIVHWGQRTIGAADARGEVTSAGMATTWVPFSCADRQSEQPLSWASASAVCSPVAGASAPLLSVPGNSRWPLGGRGC